MGILLDRKVLGKLGKLGEMGKMGKMGKMREMGEMREMGKMGGVLPLTFRFHPDITKPAPT